MNKGLRHSLAASFAAAALGGLWMTWVDYLHEQAQPRVKIIDTRADPTKPVSGWFTGKIPGETHAETDKDDPVSPSGTSPQQEFDYQEELDVYSSLSNCNSRLSSQENYAKFLNEPVNAAQKYEFLEAAIYDYQRGKDWSEDLGLTADQRDKLMATHARAAIDKWQKEIESSPDDPNGNIDRIMKIASAFWYAAKDHDKIMPQYELESVMGVGLAQITAHKYTLEGPARQQKMHEFANFSGSLTPGTESARQYLSLAKELRDVNPFEKDSWTVDGERVSNTPYFREQLLKETGMTVDQARTFFQRAETLSKQQELFDAAEQKSREEAYKKDPWKFLAAAKQQLKQCQIRIR